MSGQVETPVAAYGELDWFRRFLQDSCDTINVAPYLAQLSRDAFIAADDNSYSALQLPLAQNGIGPRLVQHRFLPLVMSKELAVRRIIIIDTEDEEAARRRLVAALREAKFPQSIVETMEIVTFFADVLPAMIAHRPAETLSFEMPRREPRRLYAIVSTPRAGSTFLGHLLNSIGLGNPIEHLRPWLIDVFRNRPPGLFDGVRMAQRLIAFDSAGGVFGTKFISHLFHDIRKVLTPSETAFFRDLIDWSTVIYLNRRNKLDQVISILRAQKTGIWHSTDQAYQQAQAANTTMRSTTISTRLPAC